MKKIKFFIAALMMLTACNKDMNDINPGSTETTNVALNTNDGRRVSVPIEMNIGSTVDVNSTPTACSGDLPGFAIQDLFINGTAWHLGAIISDQSILHHTSCNLSFSTALLTTTVNGQLAAANGDVINFSGNDVINVYNLLTSSGTTGQITGEWTITGGSGRFVSATGSISINGTVDFTTSTFTATGVGIINY